MSNDNKFLSQEEIDAMLSGAGGSDVSELDSPAESERSPSPFAPNVAANLPIQPTPNVKFVSASGDAEPVEIEASPELAPQPVASSAPDSAAMQRIQQLERTLAETNAAMQQMRQEYQAMVEQMQLVNSRVEGVLLNLKATIGYRAQKTFTCNSCKTNGNVAAKVKCTHCGEENWWGWWPQQK